MTFQIDVKRCLKLAYNEIGLDQNSTEALLGTDAEFNKYNFCRNL